MDERLCVADVWHEILAWLHPLDVRSVAGACVWLRHAALTFFERRAPAAAPDRALALALIYYHLHTPGFDMHDAWQRALFQALARAPLSRRTSWGTSLDGVLVMPLGGGGADGCAGALAHVGPQGTHVVVSEARQQGGGGQYLFERCTVTPIYRTYSDRSRYLRRSNFGRRYFALGMCAAPPAATPAAPAPPPERGLTAGVFERCADPYRDVTGVFSAFAVGVGDGSMQTLFPEGPFAYAFLVWREHGGPAHVIYAVRKRHAGEPDIYLARARPSYFFHGAADAPVLVQRADERVAYMVAGDGTVHSMALDGGDGARSHCWMCGDVLSIERSLYYVMLTRRRVADAPDGVSFRQVARMYKQRTPTTKMAALVQRVYYSR